MAHIHTEPGQHDATAGAIIIRLDGAEPRVLFHMHKKHHKLMQPGGHIELHETPWQAILHEITEETGFALDQLELLQPKHRLRHLTGAVLHPVAVCQNTHVVDTEAEHYHSDTMYAFTANGEPGGQPNDDESQDLRWLTATELSELPDDQISLNAREIALYVLSDYLEDWERVPLSDFES